MAEQTFGKTIADTTYYGEEKSSKHDFVGKSELTVTITLAEYRKLLRQSGAYEDKIHELEKRKGELIVENGKLKEAIEALKQTPSEECGE